MTRKKEEQSETVNGIVGDAVKGNRHGVGKGEQGRRWPMLEEPSLRPEGVRLPRLTIHEQQSRCGETEAEGLSAKTCQHENGTKDAARGRNKK